MKLDTDLSKNFLKIYSEAKGNAIHKDEILKTKKINYFNYIEEVLFFTITILILSIGIILEREFIYIGVISLICDTLFLMYISIKIYLIYHFFRNKNFKNSIIINEEGIKDISSFKGIELLLSWDRMSAIIINENSITILTKGYIYFYFDVKDKSKIINTIKKYKKDVLIIK